MEEELKDGIRPLTASEEWILNKINKLERRVIDLEHGNKWSA